MKKLLCFALGFGLLAQDVTIEEQLRVDYVLLDLLVLDSRGQPVTDLTLEDFTILENRKKLKADTFYTLDYRPDSAPPEVPEVAAEVEESRPQYVFALDFETTTFTEFHKALKLLADSVREMDFPENSLWMLYSLETGNQTDGFVASKRQFLAYLDDYLRRQRDRLRSGVFHMGEKQTLSQRRRSVGRPTGNGDLENLLSQFESCELILDTRRPWHEFEKCVLDILEVYVEEQELRLEAKIGQLEALTARFEKIKGPKYMFFISPGLSLQPGQAGIELARAFINQSKNEESPRDNIGDLSSIARATNYDKEFRRVIHACTRHRVVFHTFDIFNTAKYANRDFFSPFRSYGSLMNAGLAELAEESGGFHVTAPSLIDSIGKIIGRLQFYYVLGYPSPAGKKGKFRKIRVKIKRPGLKVYHRKGYFGR